MAEAIKFNINSGYKLGEIPISKKDRHQLNCFDFVGCELFGDEDAIPGLAPSEEGIAKLFTKTPDETNADAVGVKNGPWYTHMGVVKRQENGEIYILQVANTGQPVKRLTIPEFNTEYSTEKLIVFLKRLPQE